jgi:hypothetical protein
MWSENVVARYHVSPSGSITGPCSSSAESKIDDAVAYIRANISDVPTACIANSKVFCFHAKNFCIGNPQTIVTTKLNKAHFNIHCNSHNDCNDSDTLGYTAGCDTNDIYLCNRLFGGSFVDSHGTTHTVGTAQIACVIVHEIMHTAGADEAAAEAMSWGSLPWSCI